ncbi:MAG: alpha-glucosidase [Bacteroidota bacterium]
MQKTWWKESIVYQIYPRSYQDSNDDGMGDIRGIIDRLDHVKSLGINVIWLSPVFKSPNDDNGYDVSDYCDIHPDFGTMADFDELLEGIHSRGMKLLIDLVFNHSSDEHAWFEEAKSSKDSEKRNYYIWKDPGPDGGPPNNWQSFFGGSAWELDESTGQYYLHYFSKKQPDLNWENPKVREELHHVMSFWLAKGVDGFRFDVISLISKRHFEDSPYTDFGETISLLYANGPRIHEFLHEAYEKVVSKYDVMTVGEGPGITLVNGLDYVGLQRQELNMIFHFDHMFIDHGPGGKYNPAPYDFLRFKKVFLDWDQAMMADGNDGWSSIFLGNHDFSRIVSRWANDGKFWDESSKALCLMLLTMRGTPYIYQGEEIGMTNVEWKSVDEHQDIETLDYIRKAQAAGVDERTILKNTKWQSRDNARTPMQWSNESFAGFSTSKPWLKVNENYADINVQSQDLNPRSILNFYRKMVTIRQTYPALVYGDFQVIALEHPHIFAYFREDEDYRLLVVLNFSEEEQVFDLEQPIEPDKLIRIVSNYRTSREPEAGGQMTLHPWEAVLWKVKK